MFIYLQNTIQIFKQATLIFSRDDITVASVIPAMDRIDAMLTNDTMAHTFSPAIRAALKMGKLTLDRYYSLTDDSEVYRTAMGKYSFALYHFANPYHL